MIYEKKLCGKFVFLRSADIDDAEFTLSLRKNPELTRYMPTLNLTVVQQRAWIESQRSKENDYFFVVRNLLNQPVGTVSLYNMQGKIAESGRLVLIGNALENAENKKAKKVKLDKMVKEISDHETIRKIFDK